MKILAEKWRTARIQHSCWFCGRSIKPGARHRYTVGVDDFRTSDTNKNGFVAARTCEACCQDQAKPNT